MRIAGGGAGSSVFFTFARCVGASLAAASLPLDGVVAAARRWKRYYCYYCCFFCVCLRVRWQLALTEAAASAFYFCGVAVQFWPRFRGAFLCCCAGRLGVRAAVRAVFLLTRFRACACSIVLCLCVCLAMLANEPGALWAPECCWRQLRADAAGLTQLSAAGRTALATRGWHLGVVHPNAKECVLRQHLRRHVRVCLFARPAVKESGACDVLKRRVVLATTTKTEETRLRTRTCCASLWFTFCI